MPLTDTQIPTASSDAVAVLDDQFTQVFPDAMPIKITVREAAKVMAHPLENGAEVTDHIVYEPITIEMSVILKSGEFRSVYEQIKQYFLNATLFTIQTRSSSYQDMLLSDIPHDENPEMFDTIAMALSFHEADFITAQFGRLPPSKVANKTNASTVQRGAISPETPSAPKGSILYQTVFE